MECLTIQISRLRASQFASNVESVAVPLRLGVLNYFARQGTWPRNQNKRLRHLVGTNFIESCLLIFPSAAYVW